MTIEAIHELAGPNIYSYGPTMVMKLRLDELTEKESREIEGFNERLVALLPGMREHHCSRERAGGFIERIDEGTYFGHIVEHVALELSELAGIPVNFGRARYAGEPGYYNVAVSYRSEPGMRYLLETAVELVDTLVRGEEFPLDERIATARDIIARNQLGPSTEAIVKAARRRGIPCSRIGRDSLIQLGYGRNRKFIQAAMSCGTSAIGVDISCDKELAKTVLRGAAIPVPRGYTARSEEEAVAAFTAVGGPVVVKPLDGRQGLGVSLDLTTPDQVREAFHIAREYSSDVLIEELIEGGNYRVLVIDGKVVAASERIPAHVVGDGTHTIAELVDIANADPMRGNGHEKPLTKIVVDPIAIAYLLKCGRTLGDIPEAGELVPLRDGVNLSTGGSARDVTGILHPGVASLCERAARVVGLDICGVDLVMKDIAQQPREGNGAIIEVNAAPGLRMHCFPSEGEARNVGDAIIDMLYPPGTEATIPIIAITGTNGKTSVSRLIAHLMAGAGNTVGLTTTDGIYINDECIVEGDTTGPQSARTILSDPSVDIAVLETARGGIVRRGLGYDWSDVAVMTNIQPDHFGQDGIEDLEDLVYIKSLVAERVREGGTLVLNADDELLATLPELERIARVEKEIVYFSLDPANPVIRRHLERGGTAYLLRGGWIVEAMKGAESWLIRASSVPITFGGTAIHQIRNIMAATAACRAQGIGAQQIAQGLMSFRSKTHNPGRGNFFRLPQGAHVMIDYGHNPEAFKAVCTMASLWKGRRVIGIVGVPGDRDDALIAEAGRIAARGFNRIIIREDEDLRGRKPGEVAELLCRAVHEVAPEHECISILDSKVALEYVMERMQPDEIAVLFYEELEPVLDLLKARGALPVDSVAGMHEHSEAPVIQEQAPAAWPAILDYTAKKQQRKASASLHTPAPMELPVEENLRAHVAQWISTASWNYPVMPPRP